MAASDAGVEISPISSYLTCNVNILGHHELGATPVRGVVQAGGDNHLEGIKIPSLTSNFWKSDGNHKRSK